MKIANHLAMLKNNEIIHLCGTITEFKISGIQRMFLTKTGALTIIFENGTKKTKKINQSIDLDSITVAQALALVQS